MAQRKKKKAPVHEITALTADEIGSASAPAEVAALAAAVVEDGGSALCTYRDPYGAHWLILAALPIEKVSPTPFQRELSATHTKRLAGVIPKIGRYLDPVIAVRQDGGYWTPNGMHRLMAMKQLGARSIVALLVPDREIALRILALNTEKAHNLKDKSLEVVRMAHALAEAADTKSKPEVTWEFEFEEPAYLTIGHCYEEKARFSGGAYQPMVKRCEAFLDTPIAKAIAVRQARAARLLALDLEVERCVKELKDAGLTSAYLKPFVVARFNPLRFTKPGTTADFDETIDKMLAKAKSFDASKIRASDLAATGGGGAAEDE